MSELLIHRPSPIKKEAEKPLFVGRDERIRTSDILHPMQALYQAELRPEYENNNISFLTLQETFRRLALLRCNAFITKNGFSQSDFAIFSEKYIMNSNIPLKDLNAGLMQFWRKRRTIVGKDPRADVVFN